MKIKNTKTTSSKIIHFFTDDLFLYVLLSKNNLIEISIFDPGNMEQISSFLTHYYPNLFVKPTIDENNIYLPSIDGRIIGVDKFSGRMSTDIDLGLMMAVSESCKIGDVLFTPCGVPIMNGVKLDTQSYVICANDIKSGKKLFQSQSMKGRISPISVLNKIWVVADKYIHQLSLRTEMEFQSLLNSKTDFKPMVIFDKICVSSPSGSLEIFDQSLRNIGRFLVGKMLSPPTAISDEKILCVCERDIIVVNIKLMSKEVIYSSNEGMGHYVVNNGTVYLCLSKSVVKIDIDSKSIQGIPVDKRANKSPVVFDGSLFVTTDNELIQICTK